MLSAMGEIKEKKRFLPLFLPDFSILNIYPMYWAVLKVYLSYVYILLL